MPPSAKWRAIGEQRLLWEKWPGESIVYNDLSGQTHLLNETAAAALQLLREGAETAESLGRKLGLDAAATGRLLDEFDHLGLIEPEG